MTSLMPAEQGANVAAPKIVTPGESATAVVFGVHVNILLTGEDTGGTHCAYECIVNPGDGPPPHVHRHEDESFFVVDGQFEIVCGDRVTVAGPGSFVHLPKGVTHTFKNVGDGAGRFLGMAVPAGHEHFFSDADALARNGTLTPESAAAVCLRHGIELVIPPA